MWNNRRAVSGSISAVFVVLLFLLVASSLVSFRYAEDRYSSLVNDRSQREWERYNEKLTISSAMSNATGFLNASIQNVGAVTAHLVTLFVSAYNSNNSPKWQQQYTINIWMGPGNITYNFGQSKARFTYNQIKTPGQPQQPSYEVSLGDQSLTYVIKLVTERGNTFIYILAAPGQGGTTPPGVPIIPGTMQINWQNPDVESNWVRPYIDYTVLHSALSGQSSALYVRAKFVNTSSQQITIERGSVLFQIATAPSNTKIISFGGRIQSGPTAWNPGETVTIVFRCKEYTWIGPNQLQEIFTEGDNERVFTATAGFTSRKPVGPGVFYSGAAAVDGLLVYMT